MTVLDYSDAAAALGVEDPEADRCLDSPAKSQSITSNRTATVPVPVPVTVTVPVTAKPANSANPGARENFAQGSLYHNGIFYCSASEAACSVLLERYVPGFRTSEGETFQIPIGQGRSVDFLIHGIFLEYHEVRLEASARRPGDFLDGRDYAAFIKTLAKIGSNRFQRERLLRETRRQLLMNYAERRRRCIDENPRIKGTELLVAGSIDDVYELLEERFMVKELPHQEKFCAIFRTLRTVIVRQNQLARQFRKVALTSSSNSR